MDSKNDIFKWLIIIGDYVTVYAVIVLFWLFTPFAAHWSHTAFRIFLLTVFVGMTIAQLKFSTIIYRRVVTVDQVVRNVLGLVILFMVATYLSMRLISMPGEQTGRWLLALGGVLFVVLLLIRYGERYLLKLYRKRGGNRRNIVLVGIDAAQVGLFGEFRLDPTFGYHVQGYFANEKSDYELLTQVSYLGTEKNLEDLIAQNQSLGADVDEIYCSLPRSRRALIRQIYHYCDAHVIRFFYVPTINEDLKLPLQSMIVGSQEVYTSYSMPLSQSQNRLIKRAFDVVFSLLVLIPLAVFIPLIAFLIKHQSPGPVFFSQKRTGMDGKTFNCYKFRSMHVNANADTQQATKDDPRKFPFGNFMRKTNIDELPQFWNVLIGDMSIVGPRPHMLLHTEQYRQLLDKYMVRHFVKPGITGWAQVTGYRGETKELWQMEGRIQRDIWYIENWTFWLDIRIIWLTVKSFFVHDEHAY